MPTVAHALAHAAKAFSEREAFKVGAAALTYRQQYCDAVATAEAVGALPEGPVAVYCRDHMAFVSALYGTILTGRLAFLIDGETGAPEAAGIAAYFGVAGLVTDAAEGLGNALPTAAPVRGAAPETAARGGALVEALSADDFAFALLTSGTTGGRRAVPATHRNLMWTARAYNRILGLGDGHRELALVPLTHSLGVRQFISQLLVGGCLVALQGRYNPAKALVTLRDEGCDVLCAVPTQIRTMALGRFRRDLARIGPQLRHVELSSSPMHADEKADLVALLPNAEINLGYGLTEASRSSLLSLNGEPDRLETSGRPRFPGVEITVQGEDGADLGPGERGEIVVSGPNVAKAYIVGREWDTAPFRDNTFHTGDLGSLDEDGYLRLVGRMDDMINTGGMKIHPAEVEAVLHEAFPGLDCAVAQRPDPILGACPVLCLAGGGVDIDAVMDVLRRDFESYKVPAQVIRMDAIPRTANGKVIRPKLAEAVAGRQAR